MGKMRRAGIQRRNSRPTSAVPQQDPWSDAIGHIVIVAPNPHVSYPFIVGFVDLSGPVIHPCVPFSRSSF